MLIAPKELGGNRQLGLLDTLFRVFTRVRYLEISAEIESRLANAYFFAAQGRNASQAVVIQAVEAEAALARHGHAAAASLFDLDSFYENIIVREGHAVSPQGGLPQGSDISYHARLSRGEMHRAGGMGWK